MTPRTVSAVLRDLRTQEATHHTSTSYAAYDYLFDHVNELTAVDKTLVSTGAVEVWGDAAALRPIVMGLHQATRDADAGRWVGYCAGVKVTCWEREA